MLLKVIYAFVQVDVESCFALALNSWADFPFHHSEGDGNATYDSYDNEKSIRQATSKVQSRLVQVEDNCMGTMGILAS